MNEGAFIGSSQSAGDETPVEEKVPHNARDSQTEPKRDDEFHQCTGNALLFDGTAFSRIEEENLLSAFRICRPDIVLPDRKKLGGALLDSCYAKVKSVVDNHIEEMKLNACLTSDAWSNIKNEPIVNYMLISDSSTFFLESVSTGEQSHDAKWIAQDMGRIIDSLAGKMKAQLQKAQLSREPTWVSAASSNALGFLKGVFRKLEKK
ncbi:hypothetical protein BASA83_009059 [Batrachochytrium salamandrivorans]|nr:hypothetical protein BASA83_009059 [Batrachochytrium salamandrivorans]